MSSYFADNLQAAVSYLKHRHKSDMPVFISSFYKNLKVFTMMSDYSFKLRAGAEVIQARTIENTQG